MWPWIVAGLAIGTLVAGYEKGWFSSKKYSQPPVAPNGYKAPPAPPNVPPSWTYQGPPVPPATVTANKTNITIKPGDMFVSPKPGDTLVANLPSGAQWYGGNAIGIPTSIGGTTDSDATTGLTAPLQISGINGAGTAILNWRDSNGKAQQTLLDINTVPIKQ